MFRGFGGGFPYISPPFKVTSAGWSLEFAQQIDGSEILLTSWGWAVENPIVHDGFKNTSKQWWFRRISANWLQPISQKIPSNWAIVCKDLGEKNYKKTMEYPHL